MYNLIKNTYLCYDNFQRCKTWKIIYYYLEIVKFDYPKGLE